MNIGIVIGQAEKIGGMERQAVLLAREFIKREITPTLFIAGLKKRRTFSMDLSGIEFRHLFRKRFTDIISRLLLRRYCRRRGISHLIAFHVNNAELCVDAETGCRVIFNVRSIKFSVYSELAEKYRDISARADCVVTNSENTAKLLVENNVESGDKIYVIHNGIYLPHIEPQFSKDTILYAGSLKKVKNPFSFVKACESLIREKNNSIKVIMAGEGPMRPEIEKYLDRKGLKKNFELTGEIPLEEIPYGKASVFVNSSLRESSSNSILEALSHGLPVVATDNPGNRNILSGLNHHRLVAGSDIPAMAEAVDQLLKLDDMQRREVFEKSREFVRDNYSVPGVVDKYLNLLKDV